MKKAGDTKEAIKLALWPVDPLADLCKFVIEGCDGVQTFYNKTGHWCPIKIRAQCSGMTSGCDDPRYTCGVCLNQRGSMYDPDKNRMVQAIRWIQAGCPSVWDHFSGPDPEPHLQHPNLFKEKVFKKGE